MDSDPIMKAIILCAGYGTRLGNLTDGTPKPMLPIAEKPMLEYTIANLSKYGFKEIGINLHFKPEVIQDYFKDGSAWGVKLTYSYEPKLLGTAGGIKNMESFLRQDDFFLVHYGDVLTDQNYSSMLTFHKTKNAVATLLLHKRANSNSVVIMEGTGLITEFRERPKREECPLLKDIWVNSGVCMCSPRLFDFISSGTPSDLPRDVFSKLVETREFFGYPLSGYRCAVDSPERYKEAQEAITSGECCISVERNESR